ncbi:MAG: hypothetical protein OXG88_04710 [Gammaproteobacteria bacterium]|nr:hypothetical protein [Gammaproteobacteria bacterium]
MKTDPQLKSWLWTGFIGLIVLGVVGFLWFQRSTSEESTVVPTTPNLITTTSSAAEIPSSTSAELVVPRLNPVLYPPGSVGEACEVNDFPPFRWYRNLNWDTAHRLKKNHRTAMENERCRTTLERHVGTINPYLWGKENETSGTHSAFAFVVIDNPLTFERIFADPTGDLARVQEALARPECQLGPDAESNWQLNKTCHADAILNYALLTRFCYEEEYYNLIVASDTNGVSNGNRISVNNTNGVSNRTRQYYQEEDNLTPEQDRSMWIQQLEGDWVREKCKTLDPNLALRSPVHTELRKQIHSFQPDKSLNATLIDLAARLGDPTAELTYPFSVGRMIPTRYGEEGYKYGPFAGWFTNMFEPNELFIKHPPSVERLRQLVPLFAKNIGGDDGRLIKFDHEALVQYLCAPPYYTSPWVNKNTAPEPPSCRTVINELRQELLHPSVLDEIATFEYVAIRLNVYE